MTQPITAEISEQSTEYLRIPMAATEEGDRVVFDGDVEVAFTAPGVPTSGATTWELGEWEIGARVSYARVLVGPAGVHTLTAGQYQPWVRPLGYAPEAPVLRAPGLLLVF